LPVRRSRQRLVLASEIGKPTQQVRGTVVVALFQRDLIVAI
jgi:hypothetical protein